MCTTTCQSARWPTCRCECRGAYHGRTSPHGFMEVLIVLPMSTDQGADELAHLVARAAEETLGDATHDRACLAPGETHLFCTVLAALVMVLEAPHTAVDAALDRIANETTAMVTDRLRDRGSELGAEGTALLRAAVGQLVRRSADLLGLGGLAEPASIDQLRLAAVLLCPDPEGHAEVREHCLRPLDVTILRPDDDGTTAA